MQELAGTHTARFQPCRPINVWECLMGAAASESYLCLARANVSDVLLYIECENENLVRVGELREGAACRESVGGTE